MPVFNEIKTTSKFICDRCGKKIEKNPILFNEAKKIGLRNFELIKKYHYESFQLPNKTKKCFCSLDCAREYLFLEIEIFLKELATRKVDSNRKEL